MQLNFAQRRFGVLIVGLAGLVLFGGCAELDTTTVFSPPGTNTTVIMVRHAERDEGIDPPLNEEGIARAQALAAELEDDGVTAIFHPDLIRNRDTALPLLEQVDATVRVNSATEVADTKALANNFVAEVIRDHAGGVVLWIGNTGPFIEGVQSGNLQEIYARLGGTGDPPVRYQDLYTIVLTEDTPPQITEGEYGGPSSLD